MIRYNQVSERAFLLVDRETFAFQAHHGIVLRARTHLQLHLPVERVHGDLSAQYGGIKVDSDVGIEVVLLPFEHGVIAYHERDVQIPVRSSVGTLSSVSFQFNYLPVCHTCRYGDAERLASHGERLLVRDRGFPKRKLKLRLDILSAKRTFASSARGSSMPEQFLEEIGESAGVSAESVHVRSSEAAGEVLSVGRIPILRASRSASALISLPLGFELIGVFPVLPVSVVFLTLLGVAQYLVGFVYRLKLLLRARVVRIQVRVILTRQLTVCLLDIVLSCRFVNS